jgi:hypothetical protein
MVAKAMMVEETPATSSVSGQLFLLNDFEMSWNEWRTRHLVTLDRTSGRSGTSIQLSQRMALFLQSILDAFLFAGTLRSFERISAQYFEFANESSNRSYDTEKARRRLQWQPMTTDEHFMRLRQFYRDHHLK